MSDPIDDGLDDSPDVSETLRKWAKNNTVPSPVRLSGLSYKENPALVRRGGMLLKIIGG